jgi:hypothetical protein
MINKTVVIVGSVILLGVGAFIYFKPKATDKGAGALGDLGGTGLTGGANNAGANTAEGILGNDVVVQTRDNVTNEPLKNPIVKILTNTDIVAIQKLRDEIIDAMNRHSRYKKQASRNLVQIEINNQMSRLKEYGYSLDTNRNLIKIVPDYS